MSSHLPNDALDARSVPDPYTASDDTLLAFAHRFEPYALWSTTVVRRVTGEVAAGYETTRTLPGSITLLRTALFGEARSERFVDYGGFGDSDAGWDQHRRYMRRLLCQIITIVKSGPSDEDERDFARRWLTSTAPRTRTRKEDESLPLDSSPVIEATGLAAHHLAEDLAKQRPVKEALLRDRLARAVAHTAAADVKTERHVPIPEFQGVGPIDIIVRNPGVGELIAMIECKWSTDATRDKLYETAWDAIKLALATLTSPTASAFLAVAAPSVSWEQTEVADLFTTGTVDARALWNRPLDPPGLAHTRTVGAACIAGGRGNMFTHSPAQLDIELVTHQPIPGTDWIIKTSQIRVPIDAPLLPFAEDPEFPARIDQRWLTTNVPAMPEDIYGRLIARLKLKRWTETELATRVHPLRLD